MGRPVVHRKILATTEPAALLILVVGDGESLKTESKDLEGPFGGTAVADESPVTPVLRMLVDYSQEKSFCTSLKFWRDHKFCSLEPLTCYC